MIKTFELTKSNLARLVNSEPFLLPDKELIFDFSHSGYNLLSAFITLKNNDLVEKYKLIKPFNVPEKFLFAGILNAQIDMYSNGEKVKTWTCAPIKIKETETGNFELIDLLADTVSKKEFEELKASVDKLLAQHKVVL
jgi:hypothetical protein